MTTDFLYLAAVAVTLWLILAIADRLLDRSVGHLLVWADKPDSPHQDALAATSIEQPPLEG